MFGLNANAVKISLTKFLIFFSLIAASEIFFVSSSANADAYIKIDVKNVEFLDGYRIFMTATISNTGDKDANVNWVNMKSITIWDYNDNVLWNGAAYFSDVNAYVPAGGAINYSFTITDADDVSYFDSSTYRRWNVNYDVNWTNY